ncbi:head-tail adaptor protein [Streptomyces sp. ME02-6977A]|uniref:head-tail adaptor protein n=1 Tax=Streptomyces sp. ME02-6977A TaxID=3028671 RepID=UPI0029A3CD51|nr:head-tail adaptor protein [Streptomyces sp. ME02-6977A]MDX3405528.1 head-tail adaptor protein [Streptomyces sp. ME02-6977A]
MKGIGRTLNRTLAVWRETAVDDGAGGQETTLAQVATVRGKVDQPSPTERLMAQQSNSNHSHNIYLLPRANVRRGDELRGTDALGNDQIFRVLSIVQPSTPVYSKAFVELTQSQPGG